MIRLRSLLIAIPLIMGGMATPAFADLTDWEACVLQCQHDYAGQPVLIAACRQYCTNTYGGPQAVPDMALGKLD
jgi:hypothetical protein